MSVLAPSPAGAAVAAADHGGKFLAFFLAAEEYTLYVARTGSVEQRTVNRRVVDPSSTLGADHRRHLRVSRASGTVYRRLLSPVWAYGDVNRCRSRLCASAFGGRGPRLGESAGAIAAEDRHLLEGLSAEVDGAARGPSARPSPPVRR
jgi:hypothetical protein